jgi:hypothetical protein
VSLGVAGEYRSFSLVDCGTNPCNSSNDVVPPGGLAIGASAKGGYDWKWFGFRVGVLPWQTWVNPTDTAPKWAIWPSGSLRVGPVNSLRGELGFGDYGISTILRPGLWAGVVYVPDPGWELALHGGINETFDGFNGGWRGDLALTLPLTRDVQLGLGSALSEGTNAAVNPEGRVSLIAHVF